MAIKIGNKIVQSDGGGYQPQGVPDTPSQQQQNQYQQAAESMLSQGITSLSGTTGGAQGQQAAQQQQDQGYQTIQQQAQEANQLDQMLQDMGLTKEEEEKKSLAQKGKDIAQGIMTNLMGGGEGGNLDLTKEEAYTNLPAGMHPLRKQYEYLTKKYGDNWKNTTQAKVLEGYLSGVPVERGGGLGARDEGYGGGNFTLDPESTEFQEAEAYRKQLLNNLGLAGQDYEGQFMGSVGDQLGGIDIELARRGLSPEQYFNFNQQLMAADPTAENQAYKDARPFSSGAGLGALSRFIPGIGALQTFAGGLFPERDLSGFENYADYEQAGAGFRPLPVPEQSDSNEPVRRPGFMPMIPLPDPSQPVDPTYPFPVKPPNGSKFPFPVGITSAFDPRFIGPSFRGSQYTNRGVSPAFYEALRRFS